MSFFKEYIKEITNRKKEGLKPKPIDSADLIKEIIYNIKNKDKDKDKDKKKDKDKDTDKNKNKDKNTNKHKNKNKNKE